jgi:hypothetical protein
VGQSEGDGSAGEQDEAEGGFGAVEAAGSGGDDADLGVEAFDAAVRPICRVHSVQVIRRIR